MEINVHHDKKVVEILLSKKERDNPEVMESLKPKFAEYRAKKYLVATFLSGDQNLYENTLELIIRNRRRCAEILQQKEKQRLASMER